MAKPTILVVSAEEFPFGPATPLHRSGDDVVCVRDGTEALDLVATHRPKLVIFSTILGSIDAPLFCRMIRDDDGMKGTSLLAVVDAQDGELADLCLAAGCNEVIRRPIDAVELEEKIARLTSIPVRKELRTLVKLELEIEKEAEFLLGHSLNVSANGMLVQTSHVLGPEAGILLQFYVRHDPEPLRIEAKVVRAEFTGGAPRYGVRFVKMATSHREKLERFIDRLRSPKPTGGKH
jgi:CheY-like chemotaxis protein